MRTGGTVAVVQALVDDQLIDVPASVLAERERLGLDTRDEVWDGILHMNPPPKYAHSRVQMQLFRRLDRLASIEGLEVHVELGLFNPAHATYHDYRVPDLVVFRPELISERGIDGPAAMAVEVRSPGDDSFEKLPFYEAMGVGEVLVVDRSSTWVRHWVRSSGQLDESQPDDGRHRLRCVPLTIWSDGDRLFTEADGAASPV